MSRLQGIGPRSSRLRRGILLGAGLAAIAAFVLSAIDFGRDQPVTITNPREVAAALAETLGDAQMADIEPNSNLVQRVPRLDDAIARGFGVIDAGSPPFVLGEGDGVFLSNRQGERTALGVSSIFARTNFVVIGVNEGSKRLYVGESVRFDIGDEECKVTLMAIASRAEAFFSLEC